MQGGKVMTGQTLTATYQETQERGAVKAGCRLLFPWMGIGAAWLVHRYLPNTNPGDYVSQAYPLFLLAMAVLYGILLLFAWFNGRWRAHLVHQAYLYGAFFLLITAYDLATLKWGWFPLPFFPGPDKILAALLDDWQMLGLSVLYSLRLLGCGYLLGGAFGLLSGILIGWSKNCSYWLSPLLRIIGPIPATAWIPIVLVAFPTSFTASVFLVSLCVWFPVTVMTSSGIQNVNKSWIEGAQILGSSPLHLILRVAVPAALPQIFVGLFMGLGTSFVTLIAAEMLGVRAGLGWYITWAGGWAEYAKVFAALILIAALFSGLIKLLFWARDRFLQWQRGLLKW